MDYMLQLYNYYITDLTIIKYSEYINNHVFDSGWNIVFNNQIIPIFEDVLLKNYIKQVLYEARLQLRLYGFFIYFIVEDINEWVDWYFTELKENKDINRQSYIDKYPFGIMNPSQVKLYKTSKKSNPVAYLTAKPITRSGIYSYHVYNENFREEISYNNCSSIDGIKPISAFNTLLKHAMCIQEARCNKTDADWLLSHPETFVIPVPLQTIPTEEILQENIYSSMDISKTRMTETIKTRRMLLEEAADQLNRIKQHINPKYDINLRTEKKEFWNRPDLNDGLTIIPIEDAKVLKTHDPGTIIDIEKELFNYEKSISGVFGLDYRVFDSTTFKNKNQTEISSGYAFQSVQILIEMEHKKMNNIFSILYENTFGILENDIQQKQLKSMEIDNKQENNLIYLHKKVPLVKTFIDFKIKEIPDAKLLQPLIAMVEKGLIDKSYIDHILEMWLPK